MYRSLALAAALCLAAPLAQAQTVTKNYGPDPSMAEPAQRSASLMDKIMPYVPFVSPKWSADRRAQESAEAPPPPEEAVPQPVKRKTQRPKRQKAYAAKPAAKQLAKAEAKAKPVKTAKAKPAKPQPVPAADTSPQQKPDPAPMVEALTQCLSGYTAEAVKAGDTGSADHLMAQAADKDCKREFQATAKAVTLAEGKGAQDALAAIIRDKLQPAVETAMASAKQP